MEDIRIWEEYSGGSRSRSYMLVLDFLVGGFEDTAATISRDPLDVSGFAAAFVLHKILYP